MDVAFILYHGTAKRNIPSILETGILPASRLYVHLTMEREVAELVGMRHAKGEDKLVILEIDSKKMLEDGFKLHTTETMVILAEKVPPQYIINPKG